MVLEHLEFLEYIGELVDLVDGRPDAVVAAVAGRDPSLKYSRVFLTDLRKKEISWISNSANGLSQQLCTGLMQYNAS